MKCNILKNLYVKSNGDIRCDDDYGERVLLGKISPDSSFSPNQLFANDYYTQIKTAFSEGLAPWGETCEKCAFFANGKIEDGFSGKHIHKIQLEPSLHCFLLCPSCSRVKQIREGRTPLLMTQELLTNFLEGLVGEGYSVDSFEFCGQGEPLNHPEFSGLCRLINKWFPQAKTLLVTNANFDATKKLLDCKLDEIIVACDGAEQASYEQYRVNGNFETCLQFMHTVKSMSPKTYLTWKYILFAHNSSDAELIKAQALADEIDVDNLQFIYTQYGPIAERFLKPEADVFPLKSTKATLKNHPYITNMLAVTSLKKLKLSQLPKRYEFVYGKSEPFQHHLDRASLAVHDGYFYLAVDGWCVPQNRQMKLFLKYGEQSKIIQTIYAREDVSTLYAYPYPSGFRLAFLLGSTVNNKSVLQLGTSLFGKDYFYDYEFSFADTVLQRNPLDIPIKFIGKKSTPSSELTGT